MRRMWLGREVVVASLPPLVERVGSEKKEKVFRNKIRRLQMKNLKDIKLFRRNKTWRQKVCLALILLQNTAKETEISKEQVYLILRRLKSYLIRKLRRICATTPP